jgi:hypothetical protein
MTPKYSWTPTSEPPDTERRVEVWLVFPGSVPDPFPEFARYKGEYEGWTLPYVTHWRDVEPPK